MKRASWKLRMRSLECLILSRIKVMSTFVIPIHLFWCCHFRSSWWQCYYVNILSRIISLSTNYFWPFDITSRFVKIIIVLCIKILQNRMQTRSFWTSWTHNDTSSYFTLWTAYLETCAEIREFPDHSRRCIREWFSGEEIISKIGCNITRLC